MDSPEEKSPYVNFSIEHIQKAEEGAFLIQLGNEFFEYQKRYSFTKETAEKFYSEIYDGLHEMINDRSDRNRNREEALLTLMNFRILPLRFH